MAKTPSFWSRIPFVRWITSASDNREEQRRRRDRRTRLTPFESLEDRAMMAIVVNLDTTSLVPSAPAIVIRGSGFDPIVANVSVQFNDGALGVVTSASDTELTVEFTDPPDAAGALTAIVSTLTENSGTAVQVGTVVPVVTNTSTILAADATTVTIQGSGFDTTANNNTVVFNNDAIGTVTSATADELTVTFSTKPTSAGSLTAIVTTNSVSSGAAVQVATVVPVITSSTTSLAANATSLIIQGFGFDATPGNNLVDFDGVAVGTVSAATPTSITVDFTTSPRVAGGLNVIVTSNGVSSTQAVQVASVRPVVTSQTANLAASATTLVINGFGFDTIASHNAVTFNSGAVGSVTAATATTLTVTFSTKPTAVSSFTAVVATNGVSSGAAIQVATVIPSVTNRTTSLAANASTVTINGSGFDTTAANNTVLFNNGAAGTVTTATSTSLTVTFSTKPTSAGSLTAVVTTNGASSGTPIQVATVTPVITSSTTSLLANATTLTINGFGFDGTAANNSIVLSSGAVGSITAATATTLTVTFSTKPATAGSLTAVVTSNSVSSGTAVQVATVTPVITSSTSSLAANASTLSISGFGFSPTLASNTIVLDDGAVGTVTTATPTSLTVTFSTKPITAGNLNATITTNSVSSGSAVQVATVIPVVTSSTASLEADASTIVIRGFGFDTTALNNTVVFNDSAVGTVTTATATSLTVSFSVKPASAGSLTAVVTTNSLSSGSAVQVAAVKPVVTSATADLLANATTVTIVGFGFDATPGNNLVALDDGAVGAVTAATETSLTVTFSTRPLSAGALSAVVTSNSVSSGTPVQIATVVPVVTSSSANLAANATTVIISGFGFDTTASDNVVTLNDGAVGLVSEATPTSLVVTFTTNPIVAGSLTAIVTTDSIASGTAVEVATVIPVVTLNSSNLITANATTVTINGYGFDSTAGNNTVTLDDGAVGTVSSSTATSMVVTFSTKPATAGLLSAIVTTNTHASGSPVAVATVTPVVVANTGLIQSANGASITLVGIGFDTTPANNVVVFDSGAVGSVSNATATTLTVSLSSKPVSGNLKAIVTSNGVSNGTEIQVATVKPVITSSTSSILADSDSLTINGFGFDPTGSNNSITFNNGAVGTVVASTSTTLSVSFSTKPISAGPLTAVVTSNGVTSGVAAIQVGTVTPVVTSATTELTANSTSVVISGFGFSPTAGNNIVVFDNAAVGSVTAATATELTVTFSKKPKTAGTLSATITSNGISSGSAVQVAVVKPVVTVNSGYTLAADAVTLTINGLGFDTTAGNNSVEFNGGITGTVATATATELTVTITSDLVANNNLTAVVTSNGMSSGTAIQIGVVVPVVTSSVADLPANVTTLVIEGSGFDITPGNNTVVFNDDAVGTVTAASNTQLTVSFSTLPSSADVLTAIVTTNGVSSGAAIDVATVKPVVTSSDVDLAADATTITINGYGFAPSIDDNAVTFNNGTLGVVTAATNTSLTVTFTTGPTTVGELTAIVTSNLLSSGSAVQVANVIPVVTSSTVNLAADSATITIEGFGFDSTAANNTVVFNNGAVGSVTTATANSLLVTFSTKPTTAGSLTAIVTTNDVGSGTATQVATVTPVITSATATLAADATTVTISGFGFSSTAGDNLVVFNNDAVGSVTASTATSLTVTFSTKPTSAGPLTAVVTTNGEDSGDELQIATVIPVVTGSTAGLPANATSITINGFGFDAIAANNTVVLNNSAIGIVTAATATTLTVSLTTKPRAGGSLTAVVTSNASSSGSAVQIATVAPIVSTNTALRLAANANTVTINGVGFDSTAANNLVTFNNGAVGTVTLATATQLTVTFSTKPTSAGSLTAVVTTNGSSSGSAIQVATVIPVVTSSSSSLLANNTTITIAGFGFSETAGNNSVTFSSGAVGTVTAASTTSLTVTFSTRPTAVGTLTAVVSSNSVTSGPAVQVANLSPVVTSSTSGLLLSASSVVINGFGFDSTPARNTVVFNNGASGSVTAATNNSLTVSFTVKPTSVGSLTAIVTTNSQSSGSAVQIASMQGQVTASSTVRGADLSTLLISGFGFDSTAANNTVAFNSGAVGTVTSATANTLTVSFSTKPRSGSLTAIVTTNGVSTSSAVQVATIKPVVTSNTTIMAINAGTLTINGFGFDTTASNNSVVFNNGAVGTVTSATSTSLTVNLTTMPTSVGSLTAVVTSNGISSGSAVQVATVKPVVTISTANLALPATTLTISGLGFSTTAANNTVTFSNGATGTVTSANATTLTVTLSAQPYAGNLTASVTTSSISSGTAVQVASIKPVVTGSTTNQAADLTTLTIAGAGFDPTPANNSVTLSNGAVGSIVAATTTSLTVTYSTKPMAGTLTASVTSNGVSSGTAVQVATVTPVVSSSTVNLALNGTSLVIRGFGFNPTAASNTVVFSGGAVGSVTAATSTSLAVQLSTKPTATGSFTAVVTTNARSSGNPVQVASVVAAVPVPTVTLNTTSLAANTTTITIAGTGFSATAANNEVFFNNGAVGTVTSATTTSLVVTFSTNPKAGNLTAIVAANGVFSNAAVQVASVRPVVTSSTASQGAGLSTLTINGTGFDTTASSNTVVLSNGAAGTVTSATSSALTITLTARPTSVGNMTAVVTTNGKSSGTAVQVATVTPTVTSNISPLAISATTLIIGGFGFSTTAANNSVVFNNGAVGTVQAATATTLTVTLGTRPTSVGNLTATVTSNSISSGAAVQVATVRPVVTSSTASVAANTATLTINGFGFSATASENTVTFSNGAVGTVTNATATTLTVSLTTKPAAGALTAIVTTNGASSGTAVQVASVTPVITSSTANQLANASTITINGFGFDTTANHHAVTFNNNAVGTVTAATATTLTVTFTTLPRSAGNLTAVVTSNGMSSGTAVSVATVVPVLTTSTTGQAINGTTMVINGFGFDATAANNSVAFTRGAVGTVTSATPTALTITFSTRPTSVGSITAAVTSNSVSSGSAVQVATVAPAVTASSSTLALGATSMVINGFGFDTTAANNTVTFSNGAVGTVTNATATTLSISFSTTASAGTLTVVVTSGGVSSGAAVQVAAIVPAVTSNTTPQSATTSTLTINGSGFDTTASRNTVVFNNGAVGAVTAATPTSLTVTFSTKPVSAGSLTAIVTVNGVSSGAAVQVAVISPVVTSSTNSLSMSSNTVVISGFGFSTTAAQNSVQFNNGAVGTVTSATPTSLTVNLSTRPTGLGSLTAIVTSSSVSSGAAVQIATVVPAITASTASLANSGTTITIAGLGFSTTASENTVVFNNGAVGTVTAATATSLTVTFSTRPTSGNLTAVVTTNGRSSGAPVQVASVTPVVTANITQVAANLTTITIEGSGFDPIASRNTLLFSNGAVGTITAATATSLTVSFTTKPTSAGSLTVVVTTNGVSSGSAVQVATVRPVVTVKTTAQLRATSTVVITGVGFSPVAANNTVVFSKGAVGTVISATSTSLTVAFSTQPSSTGSLTGIVTSNGISSGTAVQVATLT